MSPPNVTIGVMQAKNKNMVDATHWMLSPSLMSLKYRLYLFFTSLISPPQNLNTDTFTNETVIIKNNKSNN